MGQYDKHIIRGVHHTETLTIPNSGVQTGSFVVPIKTPNFYMIAMRVNISGALQENLDIDVVISFEKTFGDERVERFRLNDQFFPESFREYLGASTSRVNDVRRVRVDWDVKAEISAPQLDIDLSLELYYEPIRY